MKYPILYDKNTTDFFNLGLGPLTNALQAKVIEERNGAFYFEGTFVNDKKFNIVEDNIIVADASYRLKNQRFIIKKITKNDDGTIKVYADHISNKTEDFTLVPKVYIKDCDADQALKIWKSSIIDKNNFIVDSDIQTINSTSWDIEDVENSRQALGGVRGSLLDTYGGEYLFDNEHISLLRKRGKTANTILAYGKNITDIEQEINIKTTYNAVYPFAKYETGEEGNKKEHIVTIDGYFVDSKYVGNYITRKAKVVDFSGEFKEDEVPTKAKLKSLGEKYVKNNNIGVPNVSLKLSFLDLAKSINYKDSSVTEEIELCDDVFVYYSDLNIETTAKVNRVEWDVLMDRFDNIEVGDKKSSLSSTISQTVKDVNEIGKGLQDLTEGMNTAVANANGKNTNFYGLFGEDGLGEPKANAIGDLWFKPYGKETQLYKWNGTEWEFILSTEPNDNIINQIEKLEKESEELDKKAEEALAKAEENHNEALKISEEVNKNNEKIDQNYKDLLDAKDKFQKEVNNLTSDLSNVKSDNKNNSSSISKLEQSYLKFDTDIKQNKKDLDKAQLNASQALENSSKALSEAADLLKKTEEQKLLINDTQADISDLQDEADRTLNQYNGLKNSVDKQGLEILATKNDLIVQTNKIDKQGSELSTLKLSNDSLSSNFSSFKEKVDGYRTGFINYAWNLTSYPTYNTKPKYDISDISFSTEIKLNNHPTLNDVTYFTLGLEEPLDNEEYVFSGYMYLNDTPIVKNLLNSYNTYINSNNQSLKIYEDGYFEFYLNNKISKVKNLNWILHGTLTKNYDFKDGDIIKIKYSTLVKGNRPALYFPPEESKFLSDRNLVLESNKEVITSEYLINRYILSEDWIVGQEYTIIIKGDLKTPSRYAFYSDYDSTSLGTSVYLEDKDLYVLTFVCPTPVKTSYRKDTLTVYNFPPASVKESTIEWIKLKKGNVVSDWTPAPEDYAKQSEVEKLSTDLIQTNESIKLKADKLTVDSLKTTIDKQSSELEVANNAIKLKADKSELNNVTKTLDKQSSELSVMSNEIKAQVEKTNENTKSISDLKLSNDNFSVNISKLEEKIDSSNIKSKNYLKNSLSDFTLENQTSLGTSQKKIDGIYNFEEILGSTIVLSIDYKVINGKLRQGNPGMTRIGFEIMFQNPDKGNDYAHLGAWHYVEEGEVSEGRVFREYNLLSRYSKLIGISMYIQANGDYIKVANPKLAIVKKCPDDTIWSMAPEDVAKQSDLIEMNTSINQTNKNIELKADKTEVNLLSKTVDKQTSELEIVNNAIKLKADKSVVDNLNKTVSNNSSSINVLNDGIKLKADKTLVDNLKQNVDAQSTSLSLVSDEIKAQAIKIDNANSQIATIKLESDKLSSIITKTNSDLESLKIGTRNLIKNSNTPFKYSNNTPQNALVKANVYSTYVDIGGLNKEYTFSVKAKGKGIFRPFIIGTYSLGQWQLEENYKIFTCTIKTWNVVASHLHFYGTDLTELDVEWIMLVEGNKIGDFSIAPEEIANNKDVLELSSRVSQTESDITAQVSKIDKNTKEISSMLIESGKISSTVSKIENDIKNEVTGNVNYAYDLFSHTPYNSTFLYDRNDNSFSTMLKSPNNNGETYFTLDTKTILENGKYNKEDYILSGYLYFNDNLVTSNFASSNINSYLNSNKQSIDFLEDGMFVFKFKNETPWIIHCILKNEYKVDKGVFKFKKLTLTKGNKIVSYFTPPSLNPLSERNLILNSDEKIISSKYLINRYILSEDWIVGQEYTIIIKGDLKTPSRYAFYSDYDSTSLGTSVYNNDTGFHVLTFTCPTQIKTGYRKDTLTVYNFPPASVKESTIEWIKLKKGNVVSDWTPAPEDYAKQSEVEKLSTSLTQTESEIKLQASKISKNENEISSLKIESEKITSEVSSSNNKINFLTSKLEQTNSNITAQVGKIDKNTSEISALKLESGKLSSTIASTKNDIDSLMNDSFNYLQNSGIKIRKSYLSNGKNYSESIPGIYNKSELSNQEVVVSVDVNVKNASLRTGETNRVGFEMVLENNNNKGKRDFIYVGAWKNLTAGESFQGRISNVVKIPIGYTNFISGGIHSQINAEEIEIKNPKVTLKTGGMNDKIYSPSPMDNAKQTDFSELIQTVDSISTKVASKAEQSSVTQLSNQITSVVKDNNDNKSSIAQMKGQISTLITDNNSNKSSITQLSNQISLKVSSNELISKINMSPENIRIQSKLIHLNGNSLIDNATIKSAMIDTISANKITTGVLNASNVFVINLNAGNISTGTLSADRIAGRSITADKLSSNAIQVGFNNMGNTLKIFPTSLNFYDGSRLSGKITEDGMQFWHGNRFIGSMGDRGKVGADNIRGISNQLNYEGDYIAWSYKSSSSESSYTTMMTLDPRGKFTGMSGIVMGQTVFVSQIASNSDNTRGIGVSTTRYNNNYYAKLSYPSGNGSGILFGASSLYFVHGGFAYSFSNLAKFANLGSMSLYIPTSLNGISSGSYVRLDL